MGLSRAKRASTFLRALIILLIISLKTRRIGVCLAFAMLMLAPGGAEIAAAEEDVVAAAAEEARLAISELTHKNEAKAALSHASPALLFDECRHASHHLPLI